VLTKQRLSPASARSLLAVLHRYQRRWEGLLAAGVSRQRFRLMDKELMALQRRIALFPSLAGAFSELVMRHAQLLRSLTRPAEDSKRHAEVQALARKHRGSAQDLRGQLLARLG
jgi:hypothetical protein